MKKADWIFWPLGLVLAALTSAATDRLSSGRGSAEAAGTQSDQLVASIDELKRSVAALREKQGELRHSVELAPAAAPRDTRTEVGGIDAAVDRWMRANASALISGAEEGAAADNQQAVQAAVDRILGGGIRSEEGYNEFWKGVRDGGLLDGVIAELERIAEVSPHDPDLQTELAGAYFQKVFALGPGPMQAIFNEKTDAAFDRALELDERHWSARFGKAIALSNWPAFQGKAGEAIKNFEILRDQQEQRPVEPRFAQTYFFLGNMYEESGQSEKAIETWRRGAELFPTNSRLAEQLATFTGQE